MGCTQIILINTTKTLILTKRELKDFSFAGMCDVDINKNILSHQHSFVFLNENDNKTNI